MPQSTPDQPLVPVLAADAPELRVFTAGVVARSVTRTEPLYSELVANVSGNIDWWLRHPQQGVHLKCTADGRIAAVILVKDFWNLCSLFVSPSLQRQGLGRRLVGAAAQACRARSPKDALWVVAAPAAVPFYQRLGFVPCDPAQSVPPGFAAMRLPL